MAYSEFPKSGTQGKTVPSRGLISGERIKHERDVANVRTFAIISHGGAGKTSLAEAMIFDAGATTRLGKVDENSSVLDFEPEEIKRKATISSSIFSFPWKKKLHSR